VAFTTVEEMPDISDEYAVPRYGLEQEPFYLFGLRIAGFFDLLHWVKKGGKR
jgi:hypothetical protein